MDLPLYRLDKVANSPMLLTCRCVLVSQCNVVHVSKLAMVVSEVLAGEPCKFTVDCVPYNGRKKGGCWSNQLPKAHTCFNKLDLPMYPSKECLHSSLMVALENEATGFSMEE